MMVLLDENSYCKVIEPLKRVTINNYFARTVVEKHLAGKIYVDDVNTPGVYYIVHPYGMSLLFGNSDNEKFNDHFREYALNRDKLRNKNDWMQVFPDSWDDKLNELFVSDLIKHSDNTADEKDKVELNGRVNFKFNRDIYSVIKQNELEHNFEIVRTDKEIFKRMKGAVVPMSFWKDAEYFCNNGVGFSLFCNGDLASTAFSSFFIHDSILEIGIETFEEYRGKGLAQCVCSALIDYCLQNNFEPLWSCRFENTGSYKLAEKLGFEPVSIRTYYKLPY